MVKNPIFMREIRAAARDPKIMALILGFMALLSCILLFLWPSSGVFSLASDSSMEIFSIFLMSNLALIILLVPALTSPTITTERENNSFDLLFTSLLTEGEILRGKLFAAITMILMVVIVSMPIASLCALSGGLGPGLLLRAYLVITMSAFTYGIMGLAFSALCGRTFTALIISYISVAIFAGATWLPYYLLGRIYSLRTLWLVIRSLSPFDALYSLIFPERYGLTQLSRTDDTLLTFHVHMGGMAVLLIVFFLIFRKYVLSAPKPGTVYRWIATTLIIFMVPTIAVEVIAIKALFQDPMIMQQYGSPFKIVAISIAFDVLVFLVIRHSLSMAHSASAQYQDQYTAAGTAIKRKLTWPFYIIDPLRRKKPIGSWRNPVFVAEMRSKIFGKPKFIIRALATCIIVSLLLLTLVCIQYATQLRPDTVRWVAILFQIGIVAILAPAISSGSITDEISSRTFLMLRMTPLSAVAVVAGKLKASFLYVSIFLISSIPVLISLAYLEVKENYWRIGAWCAVLLLTTVAFITAGLCASAFSKKTSAATAISYTFAGLVCIVTLAAELPGVFSMETRQALLTLNPIVAALRITSDTLFPEMPPNLWQHNLLFLGGISVLFILMSAGRVYQTFSRQS